MSGLDDYFAKPEASHRSYPLLRLLDSQSTRADFGAAKIEITRLRATLGFEPATMTLHFFDKQNQVYDYKTEPWDPELNALLLERKVRAVDEHNEIQRFGLGLSAEFKHVESRYGDGFFSSVLIVVVDQSPFGNSPSVRELRPYVATAKPYTGGNSADDCVAMIEEVFQDRWFELRRKLKYDQPDAERIFTGALAYYLDERFGVTDGRKLGWLKAR
jgi:hypothetical protein